MYPNMSKKQYNWVIGSLQYFCLTFGRVTYADFYKIDTPKNRCVGEFTVGKSKHDFFIVKGPLEGEKISDGSKTHFLGLPPVEIISEPFLGRKNKFP